MQSVLLYLNDCILKHLIFCTSGWKLVNLRRQKCLRKEEYLLLFYLICYNRLSRCLIHAAKIYANILQGARKNLHQEYTSS
jgi:hypothetical protein